MSRRWRVLSVAVLAFTAAIALSSSAHAGNFEGIRDYDTDITIEESGDLLIVETIAYDFAQLPNKHGINRDIPVTFDYPKKADTNRVYPLDVLSVQASEGTPADYEVQNLTQGGVGYKRIHIGDADTTITGEHTYEITYRVRGALNAFEDHDELSWNAIGHEWATIIDHATASVHAPAAITATACFQGSFGSNLPCDSATTDQSTASFAQSDLFPFNGMTVAIAIPKGVVPPPLPILEERWTFGRAFEVNATTGGVAAGLALVLVGGFLFFFVRIARDRRFQGSAVDQTFATGDAPDEGTPLIAGHTETPVEFVPPDKLRPGQVGTLVDFTANPLDVTATIVDLAVRKYVVIDELDESEGWSRKSWLLTKKKEPDDKLQKYETVLMEGIFRDGDEVKLSDLKYEFSARMQKVQKALSDDAKTQGWFRTDPSSARWAFGGLGFVVFVLAILLTVGLAIFTHAALIGLPFILLGLVMTVSSYWAPARTAKGSTLLRRVNGFRRFIDESEKERAQFAEKKNLFSEYLPYAIVFGATEKWARAFAGLDGEPPDTSYWYRGSGAFEYVAFSSAINGFTTSTAGTLTSTPPSTSGSSGFSGGGFSGGGGGGGGGGSW